MKNLLLTVTALVAWFSSFTCGAHAFELFDIDIHGFASQGYIKTTKENNFPVGDSGRGSFHFNDFAINFSKELIPGLRAGLQVLAMDRGNYGKDKITLDWAYADYHFQDWLGFRGGKVKIPLGLYNETRDNDALRTFIFLPQNEYYEYERDSIMAMIGGGLYGSIPLGGAGTVNYQLLVGTIPITSDGGMALNLSSFISSTDAPLTVTDASSTVSVVHHLDWRTPLDGLRTPSAGSIRTSAARQQGPSPTLSRRPNQPSPQTGNTTRCIATFSGSNTPTWIWCWPPNISWTITRSWPITTTLPLRISSQNSSPTAGTSVRRIVSTNGSRWAATTTRPSGTATTGAVRLW